MTHPANTLQRLSAKALADALALEQVQVIDVREPLEYAGGHIAGSRNVPLGRLASTALPDGPLVLVCQSGNRSRQGCAQLLQRRGAGLVFAGISGFCGMARLLAAMPWNRVAL